MIVCMVVGCSVLFVIVLPEPSVPRITTICTATFCDMVAAIPLMTVVTGTTVVEVLVTVETPDEEV